MESSKELTGVLLAGGKGLTAYPTTKFTPKPLFKVDGETLLFKNIKILINEFKVKEIFIVVDHLNEQIIEYVNNLNLKIKINYVHQKNINGITNALYLLKHNLKNKIVTYSFILFLFLSLMNNSRIWRMHQVENKMLWYNKLTSINPIMNNKPLIENNFNDIIYINSFWFGSFITLITVLFIILWFVKLRFISKIN